MPAQRQSTPLHAPATLSPYNFRRPQLSKFSSQQERQMNGSIPSLLLQKKSSNLPKGFIIYECPTAPQRDRDLAKTLYHFLLPLYEGMPEGYSNKERLRHLPEVMFYEKEFLIASFAHHMPEFYRSIRQRATVHLLTDTNTNDGGTNQHPEAWTILAFSDTGHTGDPVPQPQLINIHSATMRALMPILRHRYEQEGRLEVQDEDITPTLNTIPRRQIMHDRFLTLLKDEPAKALYNDQALHYMARSVSSASPTQYLTSPQHTTSLDPTQSTSRSEPPRSASNSDILRFISNSTQQTSPSHLLSFLSPKYDPNRDTPFSSFYSPRPLDFNDTVRVNNNSAPTDHHHTRKCQQPQPPTQKTHAKGHQPSSKKGY